MIAKSVLMRLHDLRPRAHAPTPVLRHWITQLHVTETQKKIKTIRYFIFFLNFNLAKEGASARLTPSLVAPLIVILLRL